MARPKVFISSTCYDLGNVRSELRPFIEGIGYEAVMSEYSDVLFDPRRHTHDSCIKELPSSDILILIIGSRLGGEALPSARALVDFEALSTDWASSDISKFKDKLSITQIEALKAVESGIPVYAFVQTDVNRDHLFYEKNKDDSAVLAGMKFPSIAKQETALYIFEFINFLRRRSHNNSIFEFSTVDDIRNQLRVQWAHLFQRLLNESLSEERTAQEYRAVTNQIEDLKAVVLASIDSAQLKDTAKGVLRYRMLMDFLINLNIDKKRDVILSKISWDELLEKAGVVGIVHRLDERMGRAETFLVKPDNTFYRLRASERMLTRLRTDWEEFQSLEAPARTAVYGALLETQDGRPNMLIREYNITVDEFLNRTSSPDAEAETVDQ